jgi:hypothetical protein
MHILSQLLMCLDREMWQDNLGDIDRLRYKRFLRMQNCSRSTVDVFLQLAERNTFVEQQFSGNSFHHGAESGGWTMFQSAFGATKDKSTTVTRFLALQ